MRSLGLWIVAAGCFAGLVSCGPGELFRIPPAEPPTLVSTGLRVTDAGGQARTIGQPTPYCSNDFTVAGGPHGRGLYVTVKMPTLNRPEVTFAGVAGDFWGAMTSPSDQALSQGPRPVTPEQVRSLAGNYVGYFIHDDTLVGNEYHVTLGILLGQGVPETGALEIRSVNDDLQNTAAQRRSAPLVVQITAPIAVSGSLSPTSGTETQALTINWTARNADSVELHGHALSAANLPLTGSRTVTLACVGDQDSAQTSFDVTAIRAGCSTPRSASVALPLTVQSSRKINRFEGVPQLPLENSVFQLQWDAPGATNVTITGPGVSQSSTQSSGQVNVTAPPVAQCLREQNQSYAISASWAGVCGPRTSTTLVSVTTAVRTFELVESGGPQCLSSNRCLAQGRSSSEAIQCASCPIAQGCSWQVAP